MHLRGPVLFGFWGGGEVCVCVCWTLWVFVVLNVCPLSSEWAPHMFPNTYLPCNMLLGKSTHNKGMLQGKKCTSNANPKNTFFDLWVSKFSLHCSATDSCSLKNAVKQPSCSKCLSSQLQICKVRNHHLEVHNCAEAKILLFESFSTQKLLISQCSSWL
jgi:hypothetical protein